MLNHGFSPEHLAAKLPAALKTPEAVKKMEQNNMKHTLSIINAGLHNG
jgi:hypothetical protein